MTHVALFHSVLGVRAGVTQAAERLRAVGHKVRVVDQYGGRVFDDYTEAAQFAEAIGYPTLMDQAAAAVADLPDGFVALGFSNGGGMAESVASRRQVGGVSMLPRRHGRQASELERRVLRSTDAAVSARVEAIGDQIQSEAISTNTATDNDARRQR